MNMANVMLEKLQFAEATPKQAPKTNQTKESFDNHYNNYKDKYNSDSNDVKSKEVSAKTNDVKGNNLKKNTAGSVKKVKQEANNQDTTVSKEEITEKVKTELAEKLDISVEDLSAILEQLNITVLDLTDKNNLNNFIQKLLNIDNPIDLLVSDKALQMYKDITQIVSEYKKEMDAVEVTSADQALLDTLPLKDGSGNEQQQTQAVETVEKKGNEAIQANVTNVTNKTNENNKIVSSEAEVAADVVQESNPKVVEIKNMDSSNKQNSNHSQGSNANAAFNQGKLSTTSDNAFTGNYTYVDNLNLLDVKNQLINNPTVSNTTAATSTTDVKNIINQVVEQIKVEVKPDVSEIKLMLRPDTLGELRLKITTENNIVTAQFVAESQQVKEVLESNFNNLKDTLQQLGLVVDELSVSVGDNGAEARQHFEQNKQKSSRRIEQIIESVNGLEEDLDEDYVNPYEVKDNQVDYMA